MNNGCQDLYISFNEKLKTNIYLYLSSSSVLLNTKFVLFEKDSKPNYVNKVCGIVNRKRYLIDMKFVSKSYGCFVDHYKYVGSYPINFSEIPLNYSSSDFSKILNNSTTIFENREIADIQVPNGSKWWFGDVDYAIGMHIQGYFKLTSGSYNMKITISEKSVFRIFFDSANGEVTLRSNGTTTLIPFICSTLYSKITIKILTHKSHLFTIEYNGHGDSTFRPLKLIGKDFDYNSESTHELQVLPIFYETNAISQSHPVCHNRLYEMALHNFKDGMHLSINCDSSITCPLTALTTVNNPAIDKFPLTAGTVTVDDQKFKIFISSTTEKSLCLNRFVFYEYLIDASSSEQIHLIPIEDERWKTFQRIELTNSLSYAGNSNKGSRYIGTNYIYSDSLRQNFILVGNDLYGQVTIGKSSFNIAIPGIGRQELSADLEKKYNEISFVLYDKFNTGFELRLKNITEQTLLLNNNTITDVPSPYCIISETVELKVEKIGNLLKVRKLKYPSNVEKSYEGDITVVVWDYICAIVKGDVFNIAVTNDRGLQVSPNTIDNDNLYNMQIAVKHLCIDSERDEYLRRIYFSVTGIATATFDYEFLITKRRLYFSLPQQDELYENQYYSLNILTLCRSETPFSISGHIAPDDTVELLNTTIDIVEPDTYKYWFYTRHDFKDVSIPIVTLWIDRSGDFIYSKSDPQQPNEFALKIMNIDYAGFKVTTVSFTIDENQILPIEFSLKTKPAHPVTIKMGSCPEFFECGPPITIPINSWNLTSSISIKFLPVSPTFNETSASFNLTSESLDSAYNSPVLEGFVLNLTYTIPQVIINYKVNGTNEGDNITFEIKFQGYAQDNIFINSACTNTNKTSGVTILNSTVTTKDLVITSVRDHYEKEFQMVCIFNVTSADKRFNKNIVKTSALNNIDVSNIYLFRNLLTPDIVLNEKMTVKMSLATIPFHDVKITPKCEDFIFSSFVFSNSNWSSESSQSVTYLNPKAATVNLTFIIESLDLKYNSLIIPNYTVQLLPHNFRTNLTTMENIPEFSSFIVYFHLIHLPTSLVTFKFPFCDSINFYCTEVGTYMPVEISSITFEISNIYEIKYIRIQVFDDLEIKTNKKFKLDVESRDDKFNRIKNILYDVTVQDNDYPFLHISYQNFYNGIIDGTSENIVFRFPLSSRITIDPECPSFLTCSGISSNHASTKNMQVSFSKINDTRFEGIATVSYHIRTVDASFDGFSLPPFSFNYKNIPFDVVLSYSFELPFKLDSTGLILFHLSRNIIEDTTVKVNCSIIRCEESTFTFSRGNEFDPKVIRVFNDVINDFQSLLGYINFKIENRQVTVNRLRSIDLETFLRVGLNINTKSISKAFTDELFDINLSLSSKPMADVKITIISDKIVLEKMDSAINYVNIKPESFFYERLLTFMSPSTAGEYKIVFVLNSSDPTYCFQREYSIAVYEHQDLAYDYSYIPTVNKGGSIEIPLNIRNQLNEQTTFYFGNSPLISISPIEMTFTPLNYKRYQNLKVTASNDNSSSLIEQTITIETNINNLLPKQLSLILLPTTKPNIIFDKKYLDLRLSTVFKLGISLSTRPYHPVTLQIGSSYGFMNVLTKSLVFDDLNYFVLQYIDITYKSAELPYDEFYLNLLSFRAYSAGLYNRKVETINGYVQNGFHGVDLSPVASSALLFKSTVTIGFSFPISINFINDDFPCSAIFTSKSIDQIGSDSICYLTEDTYSIVVLLKNEETSLKVGDSLQFNYGKIKKTNSFYSAVESFKISSPKVYSIESAMFSSDGETINVILTEPIVVPASRMECFLLFSNTNLGNNCYAIVSSNKIEIHLGYYSLIIPSHYNQKCERNSSLYFIDEILFLQRNPLLFYSGCKSVIYPLELPTFTPIIQGPKYISSCENTVNYYAGYSVISTPFGLKHSWSISSATNENHELINYVKSVNSTLLSIPKSYFAFNTVYKLNLTITASFSYIPVTVSIDIEMKSFNTPTINLNKPHSIKILTNNELSLYPIFTYSNCEFNSLPYDLLTYEWSTTTPNFDIERYIQNSKVEIPPFTLAPNSKLSVRLIIRKDSEEIYEDFINIEVLSVQFKYSLPPHVTLNYKDSLILNPLNTKDPDDNNPEFIFNWRCTTICPPFTVENSVLRFEPMAFEANILITIELITTNKMKSDTYLILVNTITNSPSLWIEGDLYNILLNQEFTATAKSTETGLMYEWSLEYYGDSIIKGKNSDIVTVSPYFLEGGTQFLFNVKATNQDSKVTHYQLILTSYSYPINGFIEVFPKIGSALETQFYISTSGWKGDEPLQYKYGFVIGDIEYLLTNEYIDDFKYTTLLPSQPGDNKVEIVVYIKSRYGIVTKCKETYEGKPVLVEVISNINTTNEFINLVDEFVDRSHLSETFDTLLIGSISILAMIPNQCSFLSCGSGKCENNKCICPPGHSGRNCEVHDPIDGGWSEWSEYQCTFGFQVLTRLCTNPKPQYNGKYCDGDNIKVQKCGPESTEQMHYSTWTNWTDCNVECTDQFGVVTGIQSRSRVCINGVLCRELDGYKYETRDCSVYCSYPEKTCPGQRYEGNELRGVECSGNGVCIKSKKPCTTDDLNCNVRCECTVGFSGHKCLIEKAEQEVITPNIKKVVDKILNATAQMGINSQFCNFLPFMNLYEDVIEKESKIDLLEILKIYIVEMPKICIDLILEFSSKLYQSLAYHQKTDTEMSNLIVEIVKMLPNEIKKNLMVSETYTRDFDSFSIKERKIINIVDAELSANSISVKIPFKIFEDEKIDQYSIEILTWKQNIYSEIENVSSPIVSLSILSDDKVMNIEDLSIPITYSQVLSTKASGEKAVCQYYNKETKSYSTDGVYTLYMTNLDENNIIIYCSTTHLSDFVTFDKSFIPKMNIVNPIKDVSLLANYNSSNFLVPLVLSILFVLFIIIWLFMLKKDRKEKHNLLKEKYQIYTIKGKINSKIGTKSVWDSYKSALTNKHLWLGVISQQQSVFLVVSRAQRTIILFCCILTDFAVLAMFYGNAKENLGQILIASIISGFIMLPVGLILPQIFTYANNLQSPNFKENVDIKLLQRYEDRGIHQSRNIYTVLGVILFAFSFLMLFPTFLIFKLSYLSLLFALIDIVLCVVSIYIIASKSTINKIHFLNILVISGLFGGLFLIGFILACMPISSFKGTWEYGMSNKIVGSLCYDIETLFGCAGFDGINHFPYHNVETSPAFIVMDQLISCKSFLDSKSTLIKVLLIPYFLIYLGLITFIIIYSYKLYKQCNRINEVDGLNARLENSSIRIQRWFRKIKHKIYIPRRKEFRNWMKQEKARSIINLLTYSICVCYIFLMIFINLIYGVKFSPKQSYSWLSACGVSLLIDFLIQQPIVIFMKTIASTFIGQSFSLLIPNVFRF